MKIYECACMDEKPEGHTRGRDWKMGDSRPTATPREEYAQADRTTDKQINESGLVSRMPL